MGVPYAEVIGDPVEHSKSPLIHKYWLETLGLEGDYRRTRVTRDGLAAFLAERRRDPDWRGCNVTAPLKEEVWRWVESDDPAVASIGAANCLAWNGADLCARNTDIDGLNAALGMESLQKKTVLLIGAGGAARAALFHVKARSAQRVTVLVRDPQKAEALREISPPTDPLKLMFYSFDQVAEALVGAHVIINASPLGATSAPCLPASVIAELSRAARGASVLDMVYDPHPTRLLSAAEALRLRAVSGLEMLLGQAAGAFRMFFGQAAPPVSAELRRRLIR
jgi:shikimate dehydrogenase